MTQVRNDSNMEAIRHMIEGASTQDEVKITKLEIELEHLLSHNKKAQDDLAKIRHDEIVAEG
jgi:hypothetical protein